jgi:hypothetical protein
VAPATALQAGMTVWLKPGRHGAISNSVVLPCSGGFASLFGRIVSLFSRLGNPLPVPRKINNLAVQIGPTIVAIYGLSQFFPQSSEISARCRWRQARELRGIRIGPDLSKRLVPRV